MLYLYFFLFLSSVCGLIHTLHLRDDTRKFIEIDSFGFGADGSIKIKFEDLNGECTAALREQLSSASLFLIPSDTATSNFFDISGELTSCDKLPESVRRIELSENDSSLSSCTVRRAASSNYYTVMFSSCLPSHPLSMDIYVEMANDAFTGYLSVGVSPLPWMYLFFFFLYCTGLAVWVLRGIRLPRARVFVIHHLMTVLLIIKILSLLFQSMEMHHLRVMGRTDIWAVPNYIFSFLRGIGFFVIIALIGTGWSFLKPFLTERDKQIFMIIIPLQVLANLAAVWLDVSSPGERGWFMLADIFRLIDLICCAAVVVPIVRQIHHLRQGAEAEGKLRAVLQKLVVFRRFYIVLFSYIYVTRILVLLLDATMLYSMVWVGELVTESATLGFMVFMYYSFRPIENNPHFRASPSEDEDDDGIDEIELVELGEGRASAPVRSSSPVAQPIQLN